MKFPVKTAAIVVTLIALFTIVIESYMDLNATHMTNPLWAPHARFHWSIQYFSSMILNVMTLYLLWGKYEGAGSRLAFIIAAMGPLLFWGMFLPSLLMPGTSAWQDGMTPFMVVCPNVIISAILTPVCLYCIYLDGKARRLRMRDSDSGCNPK